MSASTFMGSLAASFNEDTVATDLVKLFQAQHLNFGQDLINHFTNTFGPGSEPQTHDKITISHIKIFLMKNPEYVSTSEDGTKYISTAKLQRCLQIFRLLELARNIDDAHRTRILFAAIRNARSDKGAIDNGTVLKAPIDLFKYLEQAAGDYSLTDSEISDLYSKVIRDLNSVKHEQAKTIEGMAIVLGGSKPIQFKDEVADFFKVVTDHFTGNYTREAATQYEKAVQLNPALKLEELDFVRNPSTHKDLIMEKLEILRQLETKKGSKTQGTYEQFNKLIRKILQTQCVTADDKAKVEAKLKFAMSKLAIVLRQNGNSDDADVIMLRAFGSVQQHPKTPDVFKQQDCALQNGTANPKFLQKLAAVFAKLTNFTTNLLSRKDLPAEVREHIESNKIQDKLDSYVATVANMQDVPEARRKYVDRCIKVLKDIDDLYADSDARKALIDAGIADDQVANIDAIAPRLTLFDKFKSDYAKLSDRTDLDNPRPGAYLDLENVAIDRKSQLKGITHQIDMWLISIDSQLQGLQAAKLRIEKEDKKSPQLTEIDQRIALLNNGLQHIRPLKELVKTNLDRKELLENIAYDDILEKYQDCARVVELLDLKIMPNRNLTPPIPRPVAV